MRADPSSPTSRESDVQHALAEIRSCHDELQSSVSAMFDGLERLLGTIAEERTASEPRRAEPKSLQEQLSLLSVVAADLAASVGQHREMIDRADHPDRHDYWKGPTAACT